MTINWIISKIKENDYLSSKHADDERLDVNLMISEIEEVIVA